MIRLKYISIFIPFMCCIAWCAILSMSNAATFDWSDRLGTYDFDGSNGLSLDGLGNVYITGESYSGLGGVDTSSSAAYLAKYDAVNGNLLWVEQLTSGTSDVSYDVSADLLGNVFITGYTRGNLDSPNAGVTDMLLSKFDANGNLVWTRQHGTSNIDEGLSVSADHLGNVYVTGRTGGDFSEPSLGDRDAFMSKYDNNGQLLWSQHFGTNKLDEGLGIIADGLGNIYLTGLTKGTLEGTNSFSMDAYLSKFDDQGNLLWTEQFGTDEVDSAYGISLDGLGNVYVSGGTQGSLGGANEGGEDAFVTKFDINGNLLWSKQLGSNRTDRSLNVAADKFGNIYITGFTMGSLTDANNSFSPVAFISKFDSSGAFHWTEQFSGAGSDSFGYDIATDESGNIFLTGRVEGYFDGVLISNSDAFIRKYPIPEPNSCLLAILVIMGFSHLRIRFGLLL